VYLAIGRPDLHRRFTILRAAFLIVVIYPMIKYYGLLGASVATFVSLIISYIFQIIRYKKISNISLLNYFIPILKSCIISIPICIIGYLFKNRMNDIPIVGVSIGLSSIVFAYFLYWIVYVKKYHIAIYLATLGTLRNNSTASNITQK
jgi:O-antigen/teichoic acid export membrane protein